jgi:hypothetical protein
MIVDLDLESSTCRLLDPTSFTAFSARCQSGDSAVVGPAMGDAGHAADESDHVWVSIDWLIEAAAGDHEWRERFGGMVDYATSKGWTNAARTHLKAHLETRP